MTGTRPHRPPRGTPARPPTCGAGWGSAAIPATAAINSVHARWRPVAGGGTARHSVAWHAAWPGPAQVKGHTHAGVIAPNKSIKSQ